MRHFYFPMELTKCLEWSNRLVQIKVLLGTVLLNSRTASPSQSNGNVTVNPMHVLLFQHGKDWFALSLSLETYTEQTSSHSNHGIGKLLLTRKSYSLIQSVIPFRGHGIVDFAQTCFALIALLSKRTVTANEHGMILAHEKNCYFYLIC